MFKLKFKIWFWVPVYCGSRSGRGVETVPKYVAYIFLFTYVVCMIFWLFVYHLLYIFVFPTKIYAVKRVNLIVK